MYKEIIYTLTLICQISVFSMEGDYTEKDLKPEKASHFLNFRLYHIFKNLKSGNNIFNKAYYFSIFPQYHILERLKLKTDILSKAHLLFSSLEPQLAAEFLNQPFFTAKETEIIFYEADLPFPERVVTWNLLNQNIQPDKLFNFKTEKSALSIRNISSSELAEILKFDSKDIIYELNEALFKNLLPPKTIAEAILKSRRSIQNYLFLQLIETAFFYLEDKNIKIKELLNFFDAEIFVKHLESNFKKLNELFHDDLIDSKKMAKIIINLTTKTSKKVFHRLTKEEKAILIPLLDDFTKVKNIFNWYFNSGEIFAQKEFFKELTNDQQNFIIEYNDNIVKTSLNAIDSFYKNGDINSLINLLLKSHYMNNIEEHKICKPGCDGNVQYCQSRQLNNLINLGKSEVEKKFLKLRGIIDLLSLSLTGFIHNKEEAFDQDTYCDNDPQLWDLIAEKKIVGVLEGNIIIQTNKQPYIISYSPDTKSILFEDATDIEIEKATWI